MTSVITGDIINSRKLKDQEIWLAPLKDLMNRIGEYPQVWEIYRGDSFQLEINQPDMSLLMALKIKATIKSIKGIDVRMAIGIGEKDFYSTRVTESNGEAFVFSGESYENLKKDKQTMAIRTPWQAFNKEMNLCLRLALIAMDGWSRGAAEFMKIALENRNWSQSEIGKYLGITQSSVSERQNRSHWSEIMDMEELFKEKLNYYLHNK